MGFRSCFLSMLFVLSFLTLGFPLPIPKEGNFDALHNLDNAVLVRDYEIASNGLSDPLSSTPGPSDGGYSSNPQLPVEPRRYQRFETLHLTYPPKKAFCGEMAGANAAKRSINRHPFQALGQPC